MKLYAVDIPTIENQGEGEDTREWFASSKAAMARFREVVGRIKAYNEARERTRAAFRDGENNGWTTERDRFFGECGEAERELDPGYTTDLVTVDLYDVPTKLDGLLAALNTRFTSCHVKRIATHPDPDNE